MHIYLKAENVRRDRLMAERGLTLDTYTEEMRESERECGDDATVSSIIPSSSYISVTDIGT
jgi:hypothetical protein